MEELKGGFYWGMLAKDRHFAGIELLVLAPILYGSSEGGAKFFFALLFSGFLLFLSAMDIRYGMIYNRFLLPMGLCGLLQDALIGKNAVADGAAAAFLLGGSLWLIRWASRGGMGGGDVKLGWVLGIWLGWDASLVALMFSFFLGSLLGTGMAYCEGRCRSAIPFGPFLAFGALVGMLYGEQVIGWYVGLIL